VSPHIHLSFIDGLITFLFVLLFGTAWRLLASRLHDRPIGQAMAFAY